MPRLAQPAQARTADMSNGSTGGLAAAPATRARENRINARRGETPNTGSDRQCRREDGRRGSAGPDSAVLHRPCSSSQGRDFASRPTTRSWTRWRRHYPRRPAHPTHRGCRRRADRASASRCRPSPPRGNLVPRDPGTQCDVNRDGELPNWGKRHSGATHKELSTIKAGRGHGLRLASRRRGTQ